MKKFKFEIIACFALGTLLLGCILLFIEPVFPQIAVIAKFVGYFAVCLVVAVLVVHFVTKDVEKDKEGILS